MLPDWTKMHWLQKTCLSLILILSSSGMAETVQGQLRGSSDKVELLTYLSADIVIPGESFRAAVVLDIEEGWHVNAHRPSLEYLIGTELMLDPHDGFILSDIRYPEPVVYEFSFAGGEPLLLYEGLSIIFLELRAASRLLPGLHQLTGSVRVQACDDQNCLAPSVLPFEFSIQTGQPGDPTQNLHVDIFERFDKAMQNHQGVTPVSGTNEIEFLFQERGMILAFFALFLIGLALNLTPCVYPMMSVTVSLFGGQSDSNSLRIFSKAVVYVLGIATMYSFLGVMASFSGELFGNWLQHPWVLGSIGILLFALALSMFGLYEIQIPYWITTRLGAGQVTGYMGTWFSGLLVGIFAAPCIGPPIIALLAFIGARGDPVFGFWSFFILSLGLGFPYLILATFSGLLNKMPRSGIWMVWVKKVFGVILIALALFYLAIPFFSVSEAYWILPIALIGGGIYLGFLEASGRRTPVFSKVKAAFGIICMVAGMMVFANMQKESISWLPYNENLLAEAQANEQPVIIDFYADWCIPCLELERITFTDPEVMQATRDLMKLKVDLTHFDSPESENLRRQYDVAGVPTIIFLDKDGIEVPGTRIVGFAGPGEFLRRMEPVFEGRN